MGTSKSREGNGELPLQHDSDQRADLNKSSWWVGNCCDAGGKPGTNVCPKSLWPDGWLCQTPSWVKRLNQNREFSRTARATSFCCWGRAATRALLSHDFYYRTGRHRQIRAQPPQHTERGIDAMRAYLAQNRPLRAELRGTLVGGIGNDRVQLPLSFLNLICVLFGGFEASLIRKIGCFLSRTSSRLPHRKQAGSLFPSLSGYRSLTHVK